MKNSRSEIRWELAGQLCGIIVAATVLALYWATAEKTVSFWDCPEYVVTALGLQIGHPPGNPTWQLAACVASIFASPEDAAFVINKLSALYAAAAVWFLYSSLLIMLRAVGGRRYPFAALAGAVIGSACFAFCDSQWYSAIEAEVYSMSIAMTAACVWIAVKWAQLPLHSPKGNRLLALNAYLVGLSLGCHQLNLLCLPAIALIIVFRTYSGRKPVKTWSAFFASMIVIAAILFGLMPGSVRMAQEAELLAVNILGLPFNAGVIGWVALFFASALALALTLGKGKFKEGICWGFLFFISGVFAFSWSVVIALSLSAIAAFAIVHSAVRTRMMAGRCFLLLLAGYSIFALLPVRGAALTPLSTGSPADIFSYGSYASREQYGSHPLFYGPLTGAQPLRMETLVADSAGRVVSARYDRVATDLGTRRVSPRIDGGVLPRNPLLLNRRDSLINNGGAEPGRDGYVIYGYSPRYRYAPQLCVPFPRLFSNNAAHIEAYADWAGMTPESMEKVEIDEAVSTDGKSVGRFDVQRQERVAGEGVRPTLFQNVRYFVTYQLGYMYLRYLMWNFSGRQNTAASQGQADRGNFITGIAPVDDLMLGPQSLLPDELGAEGGTRTAFFLIPFGIGIFGIVSLCRSNRIGKRAATIILVLFIMTGAAIVVYLNQTPGEPRERDYSFIGSYYAFAAWIGAGVWGLVKIAGRKRSCLVAGLLMLVPVAMATQGFRTHDRSNRKAVPDLAFNILESLPPDAILFTNGDNFTFPLWYAQQVLGMRRDVTVVNLAYLATSWYPVQLISGTSGNTPLQTFASVGDLIYGAYSYIGIDMSGHDAIDASTALRRLYDEERDGFRRLAGSKLRLAPLPGSSDSLVIDLSAVSRGGRLQQRHLLMLDILASQAQRGWRRPVAWVNSLNGANTLMLDSYLATEGLTLRLASDSLRKELVMRNRHLLTEVMRNGNMHRSGGLFVDEPTSRFVHDMRRLAISTADSLLAEGRKDDALTIVRKSLVDFPAASVPLATLKQGFFPRSEGAEFARIMASDSASVGEARAMAFESVSRSARFARYISGLPAWLRHAVDPETRLERAALQQNIELYLSLGGKREEITALPGMKKYDFEQGARILRRTTLACRVAAGARIFASRRLAGVHYSAADSTFVATLNNYVREGGTRKELLAFREFDNFPFSLFPNLPL